eukprot:3195163-Prymnesium_polylepis.2
MSCLYEQRRVVSGALSSLFNSRRVGMRVPYRMGDVLRAQRERAPTKSGHVRIAMPPPFEQKWCLKLRLGLTPFRCQFLPPIQQNLL